MSIFDPKCWKTLSFQVQRWVIQKLVAIVVQIHIIQAYFNYSSWHLSITTKKNDKKWIFHIIPMMSYLISIKTPLRIWKKLVPCFILFYPIWRAKFNWKIKMYVKFPLEIHRPPHYKDRKNSVTLAGFEHAIFVSQAEQANHFATAKFIFLKMHYVDNSRLIGLI